MSRPARLHTVRALAQACDTGNLRGLRDRAIVLLAFTAALRRKEMTELRVADVAFVATGMVLTIAEGMVGVPYAKDQTMCPVLAVKAWIRGSRVRSGALFRAIGAAGHVRPSPRLERDGAKLIARAVKSAARRAGIDPGSVSTQSLRSGLAVEARRIGVTPHTIARHGRWSVRSVQRILARKESQDET
jgi:integrase